MQSSKRPMQATRHSQVHGAGRQWVVGIPISRPPLPAHIISHAVWLYHRFTLSDVEDLLGERGVTVSHEADGWPGFHVQVCASG